MPNDNSGHRQRMREKFAKSGFSGFHDYEALEYLLFYILPRKDTKPLAKALIKKFGGFAKTLDAPIKELKKVAGMGEKSAVALKAFRSLISFYFDDLSKEKKYPVESVRQLINHIQSFISGEKQEILLAVLLNGSNEIIETKILEEGAAQSVNIYERKICSFALDASATAVVIAHNHPGGAAEPSEEDIEKTYQIKKALNLLGIELIEHIIVARGDYFSFTENSIL